MREAGRVIVDDECAFVYPYDCNRSIHHSFLFFSSHPLLLLLWYPMVSYEQLMSVHHPGDHQVHPVLCHHRNMGRRLGKQICWKSYWDDRHTSICTNNNRISCHCNRRIKRSKTIWINWWRVMLQPMISYNHWSNIWNRTNSMSRRFEEFKGVIGVSSFHPRSMFWNRENSIEFVEVVVVSVTICLDPLLLLLPNSIREQATIETSPVSGDFRNRLIESEVKHTSNKSDPSHHKVWSPDQDPWH